MDIKSTGVEGQVGEHSESYVRSATVIILAQVFDLVDSREVNFWDSNSVGKRKLCRWFESNLSHSLRF